MSRSKASVWLMGKWIKSSSGNSVAGKESAEEMPGIFRTKVIIIETIDHCMSTKKLIQWGRYINEESSPIMANPVKTGDAKLWV